MQFTWPINDFFVSPEVPKTTERIGEHLHSSSSRASLIQTVCFFLQLFLTILKKESQKGSDTSILVDQRWGEIASRLKNYRMKIILPSAEHYCVLGFLRFLTSVFRFKTSLQPYKIIIVPNLQKKSLKLNHPTDPRIE